MNSKSKGKLVLYTGSSGVGKGTIMAELFKAQSQYSPFGIKYHKKTSKR